MRAHLIHGFRIRDGGAETVGRLAPYVSNGQVEAKLHNYGYVSLLGLRRRNEKAVEKINRRVDEGDVLVGHSNGCLIAWELVKAGVKPAAVICVQPALRRDTIWPEDLPVLCVYNEDDRIVTLGRWWSRFVSVANPWQDRHGWGAAGRHGFDQASVTNISTLVGPTPAEGHSEIFKQPALQYWGGVIGHWLERKVEAT
jgi:pimeloyl-ACP methyl ester carboxylesterase